MGVHLEVSEVCAGGGSVLCLLSLYFLGARLWLQHFPDKCTVILAIQCGIPLVLAACSIRWRSLSGAITECELGRISKALQVELLLPCVGYCLLVGSYWWFDSLQAFEAAPAVLLLTIASGCWVTALWETARIHMVGSPIINLKANARDRSVLH